MLITITGKAGSGKSTAAKIIAEKLGYEYISIGEMRRKIADQMGLNIIEFNKLGELPENQHEFDLKYEEYQRSLPVDSNIVLESRLGFRCQPNSFKIFLSVDDRVAAQRIFEQSRDTDSYASLEETYETTIRRNNEDIARYQSLYNINYQEPSNFDLFLDTTGKSTDETVDLMINLFNQRQANHE